MSPAVFFDLDGVLADFVRGAFRLHGRSVPMREVRWNFLTQIGFADEHDPAFWNPMGRTFWANLEPLADGFELLRAVEEMVTPERIGLLTSAAGTDGCLDGKRDWVKRHLPGYAGRFFTGAAKTLFAGPSKILVDDNDTNVITFRGGDGWGVLVPRPWNLMGASCRDDGEFRVGAVLSQVETAVRWAKKVAA